MAGSYTIISHMEDCDGIVAGTIASAATGGAVELVDYTGIIPALKRTEHGPVVLLDLGINQYQLKDLTAELVRLHSDGTAYVDHHLVDRETKDAIEKTGTLFIHDGAECAAVIAYYYFQDRLPKETKRHFRLLACIAAMTDYRDTGPLAMRLLDRVDRIALMRETAILSAAVSDANRKRGSSQRLRAMAEQLKSGRMPHEFKAMRGAFLRSMWQDDTIQRHIAKHGRAEGNFAVCNVPTSTGYAANLLRGAFDVPVAMAYTKDGKHYLISLRADQTSEYDVGSEMKRLAAEMGFSGGGHSKAAGGRIRRQDLETVTAAFRGLANGGKRPKTAG